MSPAALFRVWLSRLASAEVREIEGPYTWPPRGPLAADEQARVDELTALSERALADACRLAGARGRLQRGRVWCEGVEALGAPPSDS